MPTCPRRMMDWGSQKREENLDDFYSDGTCTFCGSINPDTFMKAVRAGQQITPTDKNYKAYLSIPGRSFTKFYFQHLSEDQKHEFVELYNNQTMLIEDGGFYVLPYFVKLVPDGA